MILAKVGPVHMDKVVVADMEVSILPCRYMLWMGQATVLKYAVLSIAGLAFGAVVVAGLVL